MEDDYIVRLGQQENQDDDLGDQVVDGNFKEIVVTEFHSLIFLLDLIQNGKSLEKIEIMHKTRKLNLKKLYAPQAYHVTSEAVCIQKMQSGYVETYPKMEDQVKHKYVPKPVVELHNVDLPRYTVFIDDRGMIEASVGATMHPPVNKYNPQLKPLRIDTDPIADSEIRPIEILGTNC